MIKNIFNKIYQYNIICNIYNLDTFNSYIKYTINKWIAYIQDIDKIFIKEYHITNIIDLFTQINYYMPLYKIINIVDLQINDNDELILINKDCIEYKFKYYSKINFKYVFPQLLKTKENIKDIVNNYSYNTNNIINKFIVNYNLLHSNLNVNKYKQKTIIKVYEIIIIVFIIIIFFILKIFFRKNIFI